MLKISEPLKKQLTAELKKIAKKIKKEEDLRRKVYFYSAVYSMADRVMRLNFDPELLLMNVTLQVSYTWLRDRVNAFAAGNRLVPISSDSLNKLADYITELSKNIEKEKSVYKTLEKILLLCYTATGPGYYMSTMGQIENV